MVSYCYALIMDISDHILLRNRDWVPDYLLDVFSSDFFEYRELWSSGNSSDRDLVTDVEKLENTVLLLRIFLWMIKNFVKLLNKLSMSK